MVRSGGHFGPFVMLEWPPGSIPNIETAVTYTALSWSRKGEVACPEHAPDQSSERWVADGWRPISPTENPRGRYQCAQCSRSVIRHQTRGERSDAAPLILNVDDQPANLYARDRVLRMHGFNVANAETGRSALYVARELHPRLVLLDIHLPDIDGRELCQQIKGDAELSDISVVLISSTLRGDVGQLESVRWGHADAFIAEPVTPDALAATIRRVLASA